MELSNSAPLSFPWAFSKISRTVWNYAVSGSACHTPTADLFGQMKA